jgi:endonuclease/exonuclease/phosphatase family metal-dependent hydrolase
MTYNIHKGISPVNKKLVIHQLRRALHANTADVVFLQEVQGDHQGKAKKYRHWPSEPQHLFLADNIWPNSAYGSNAHYNDGHHGNAVLSKFPILREENFDVSLNPMEKRGVLYCQLELKGKERELLHLFNIHLNLLAPDRRRQFRMIKDLVLDTVPQGEPVIVAGDFNDWREEATDFFSLELSLVEAFKSKQGAVAKTFPASLPILKLDRVYTRGFMVLRAERLRGNEWSQISDHLPLRVQLQSQIYPQTK